MTLSLESKESLEGETEIKGKWCVSMGGNSICLQADYEKDLQREKKVKH